MELKWEQKGAEVPPAELQRESMNIICHSDAPQERNCEVDSVKFHNYVSCGNYTILPKKPVFPLALWHSFKTGSK